MNECKYDFFLQKMQTPPMDSEDEMEFDFLMDCAQSCKHDQVSVENIVYYIYTIFSMLTIGWTGMWQRQ